MKLKYILHVTGYSFVPTDRKFQLSGLLYMPPRFPCHPENILERADLGCPSLGHSVFLPATATTGLLVPIIEGMSTSVSSVIQLTLLRGSEDKVGYGDLFHLKGFLVPVYEDVIFNYSSHQRYLEQSRPYYKEIESRTSSPSHPLDRYWTVR